MTRNRNLLALALGLALGGGAAFGQNADEGAAIFMDHCATCHGTGAKGDGPMAGVLMIKPSDLTALSSANNGVFPLERVIKRVDGRDPLVAHGSPMPVYGYFFEGDDTPLKTASGQPIMTSRAIADLVAYLKGVQP